MNVSLHTVGGLRAAVALLELRLRLRGLLLCALLVSALGCLRSGFEVPGRSDLGQTADAGFAAPQSFQVRYITSQSACLGWDASTLEPAAQSYNLWYGSSLEDVLQRSAAAREWNSDDDPNLGYGFSPFGPQLVQQTTLVELTPDTTYHAVLWAQLIDNSEVLLAHAQVATLLDPVRQAVIFAETAPGWSLGFEDSLSSHAHSGNRSLWFAGDGDWKNGIMGDYRTDIADIDADAWQRAFVELYLEVDSSVGAPEPLPYVELALGDDVNPTFSYQFPQYFVVPARSGWQRVQIALHAFVNDAGKAMTRDRVSDRMNWLRVGAEWPAGRNVYIDDIRIRY